VQISDQDANKMAQLLVGNAVLQNLTKTTFRSNSAFNYITNDFTRFCRFPSLIIVLKKPTFSLAWCFQLMSIKSISFLMNAKPIMAVVYKFY